MDTKTNTTFMKAEVEGPLAIGRTYTFSKTVGESDVYLFAGITGDFSPNHVNDEYMAKTRYGKRIAHGVLSIGFMSTCSTMVIDAMGQRPAVSYGYDRVRFVNPIYIGDTVTVEYRIAERDEARGMTMAEVTVKNQRGELCTVATHLLKLV